MKNTIFIITIIVIAGIIGTSFFSITPQQKNELTFSASKSFDPEGDTPITNGKFEFSPNCEVMEALEPVLLCNFATNEDVTTLNTDQRPSCAKFRLKINNQILQFSKGETIKRQGYDITLTEGNAAWIGGNLQSTGDIRTAQFFGAGEQTIDARTQRIIPTTQYLLDGFSATWKIGLHADSLNVSVVKDELFFEKTLPKCTITGTVINDAPRILGATVIKNSDNTFTSVGVTRQIFLQFPIEQKGQIKYPVSPELGMHSLVFKPFVSINGILVERSPELKKDVEITSEGNNYEVINTQKPTLWQKILAFFKKTFEVFK